MINTDDFESSPGRTARGEQKVGKSAKPSTAASQRSRSTEREQNEASSDSQPPPVKKSRQSRDERQFSKDTEKALTHSAGAQPNPTLSSGAGETEYQPSGEEDEEEEDNEFSGSASSSDGDFSDAGPSAKMNSKKTKPAVARAGEKTSAAVTRGKKVGGIGKTCEESQKPAGVGDKRSCGVKNSLKSSVGTPPTVSPSLMPTTQRTVVLERSASGTGSRKIPKWTPPGPAAGRGENCVRGGNRVANKGTPLIRLGLSRRARVKPLHNSPQIQH